MTVSQNIILSALVNRSCGLSNRVSQARGGLFFGAEDITCKLRVRQVDIIGVVKKLRFTPSRKNQAAISPKIVSVLGSNARVIAGVDLWTKSGRAGCGIRTAAATNTTTERATTGPRTGIALPAQRLAPTGFYAVSSHTYARRLGASLYWRSSKSFSNTSSPERIGNANAALQAIGKD